MRARVGHAANAAVIIKASEGVPMAQREEILTAANGSVTGNRVVRFAISDSFNVPVCQTDRDLLGLSGSYPSRRVVGEILLLQQGNKTLSLISRPTTIRQRRCALCHKFRGLDHNRKRDRHHPRRREPHHPR